MPNIIFSPNHAWWKLGGVRQQEVLQEGIFRGRTREMNGHYLCFLLAVPDSGSVCN